MTYVCNAKRLQCLYLVWYHIVSGDSHKHYGWSSHILCDENWSQISNVLMECRYLWPYHITFNSMFHGLGADISSWLNQLWPRQNGHCFTVAIFKCIFFNKNVWISIKTTLKFVSKDPINNIPALFQIMAWHRPGDKPLKTMMVNLLHICISWHQWVNNGYTE